MFTKKIIAVLAGVALLMLSACDNGTVGSNAVSGLAAKGPFQAGSTVTAQKLNADGTVDTAVIALTTFVTDNLGSYSFAATNKPANPITWSGLTEISITGSYLDENTGAVIINPATLKAVMNLPAIGAAISNQTVNPNIASTVAADLAIKQLKMNPVSATNPASSFLRAANVNAAKALGLPVTDANGAAIDLNRLDVTKTADPAFAAANQQLLAVSASMILAAGTVKANAVDLLVGSLANDVASGQPLGTANGSTTAIITAQTKVQNNAATIAGNLTAAVEAVNPGTSDTTLVNTLPASSATVVNTSQAVIRGFAASGNTFTMGTAPNPIVTYTLAASGAATAAAVGGSQVKATNVVVGVALKDYSNAAGDAPLAATYAAGFSFDLAAVAPDKRAIHGTLAPVNVVSNGAGIITITIPANAVLTYAGTDSTGLAVQGTGTNIAANVFTTTAAGVLQIDANALLNQITTNTGQKILATPGTFNFNFAFQGFNVGFENAAAPGMTGLFPVHALTNGRAITGQMTTF